MQACPGDNTITLLMSGQLDGALVGTLDAHVVDCAGCRDIVGILRRDCGAHDSIAAGLGARMVGLLPPGTLLGRYRIEQLLGSGGMGVVYAAHDPELDRDVAVKLLFPALGLADSDLATRLLREARSLAQLAHANVVGVYDVGRTNGDLWVAMEYVSGPTLAAWTQSKSRSLDELLGVYVGAGRGLAAAHAKGIVHRDFKPTNVLISESGHARVADFGLARWDIDRLAVAPHGSVATRRDGGASLAGSIVGTPRYMAPEQLDSGVVGPAADQFAFCASLYEAVTGRIPEAGARAGGKLPRWLEAVLLRGLARAPGHRFETMDSLLAAIGRGRARRKRVVHGVAAAVALAAIGCAGLAIGRGRHDPDPCASAGDELATSWNDDRRAAITTAFGAAGNDGGQARRAITELDQRADEWRAARVDACRANRVRGEESDQLFDRRVECLARRRTDLETLAVSLSDRVSPDVARRALDAIAGLTPLDACRNTRALLALRPPPEDPHLRAKVDDLARQIDAAETEFRLGRANAGALVALHAEAPRDDHAGRCGGR